MKTKFKDLLLYSLATIGVVALFISATQTQVSHTTPESHVWDMHTTSDNSASYVFAINKICDRVDLSCRRRQRLAILQWAYDPFI